MLEGEFYGKKSNIERKEVDMNPVSMATLWKWAGFSQAIAERHKYIPHSSTK